MEMSGFVEHCPNHRIPPFRKRELSFTYCFTGESKRGQNNLGMPEYTRRVWMPRNWITIGKTWTARLTQSLKEISRLESTILRMNGWQSIGLRLKISTKKYLRISLNPLWKVSPINISRMRQEVRTPSLQKSGDCLSI